MFERHRDEGRRFGSGLLPLKWARGAEREHGRNPVVGCRWSCWSGPLDSPGSASPGSAMHQGTRKMGSTCLIGCSSVFARRFDAVST
jgi:hypothetical protein